jgi:3D (Asp-Asp-Asp) domain-containing protein
MRYKLISLPIIAVAIFYCFPAFAAQTCVWKEEIYSYPDPMTSVTIKTGGCSGAETLSSNSQCSGDRPSATYVCCCGVTTNIKTTPQFKIPELQIKIPGILDGFSVPTDCDTDAQGNQMACRFTWIAEYLTALYKYGFSIVGILAAIILMIGGVIWLTSAGDASRVAQAKKLISGSITGIVVLFSSFLILSTINPDLITFLPLDLNMVNSSQKKEKLAESKAGGLVDQYKKMPCPTSEELKSGVTFFATGYYKPDWKNTHAFFCDIGMNCSCPNGRSKTEVCEMYNLGYTYYACNYFDADVPYCNSPALEDGDIAADLTCLDRGSKICVDGKKEYTVKDSGGAIKGRRIDVWSGNNLNKAYKNTGTVTVKAGPCN